jgi:hypothetical protein
MKPDEMLARINSWITKEVDCDITNLTFIYSGHGIYDGLLFGDRVLSYANLIIYLLGDL